MAPVQALVIERPDSPRAWIADYMDRGRGRDGGIGDTGGGNAARKSAGGDRAHESWPETRPNSSNSSSWAAPRPPSSTTTDATATAVGAAPHGETVEADTEDPEDTPDLNALLLPSGALPLDAERFSVSYSTALLAGWVKQGSPCCAAASLAGAWNALGGKARGAPGALDSDVVLSAMRAVVEEQITGMVARFERLLQGSLDPLLRAIAAELALEGKHLGGRGPKAATASGPHLLRLTRSITSREREMVGHAATFDLLWDLYEEERKEAADAAAAATTAAAAETVAEVISAGAAAAAAAPAPAAPAATATGGSSSSCVADKSQVGGARNGERAGSCPRQDRKRGGTEEEKGVGSPHARAEGAESEVSTKASGTCGGGTTADTAEAGADKIPRRPSTGCSRGARGGGGLPTTPTECRPGKTLRRPRSAGDLGLTGGGDGGWEGAEGLGPARPCWEKRNVEEEEEDVEEEGGVEDEEDVEEEEEQEEQELVGGLTPAHRRRSSGRKGGSAERGGRRRKGSNKAARFRRGSGREALASPRWRWKKDLCALLKRMGGLDKVTGTAWVARCTRNKTHASVFKAILRDDNPAKSNSHAHILHHSDLTTITSVKLKPYSATVTRPPC